MSKSTSPLDPLVASPPRGASRKMRVVSAALPLDSDGGHHFYEMAKQLSDRIDYEFVIDDCESREIDSLRAFCARQSWAVHFEPLVEVLRQRRWDAIECTSWECAAAHAKVLPEIGEEVLAYTPGYSPSPPVLAPLAQSAHFRLIERADVVFCGSSQERSQVQSQSSRPVNCMVLPSAPAYARDAILLAEDKWNALASAWFFKAHW